MKAAVAAGLALALGGQAFAVEDFICFWGGNASGSWSQTDPANTGSKTPGWWDRTVPPDGVGDVPDDVDLLDGTNVTARVQSMTGNSITLDSNRTVGRLWYNWDGSSSYNLTAKGSFTLNASGGSVLTLAREDATPQIHIGYRFAQNNYNIGVTINAPLAGTQGFTVGSPGTVAYGGFGLVLGGANTLSGTISGFRLLTLKNELAAQNAALSINGTSTLRLRHDTDNATFSSAGIVVNAMSTSGGATINVDRNTADGETGHRLILGGPITVSGQDRIKTLSITGDNGYSLELTGGYTNTFASKPSRIDADSANVALSGSTHDLGGGLVLGGALATGINTMAGTICGAGGITKTNDATWALTGANAFTGPSSISGGNLLIDGGSIGTTETGDDAVSVNAGGTLGGDGGTVFADVAVAGSGAIAPGSVDDAGSLIGTLTIGGAAQAATVGFADNAVLAIDVGSAAADLLVVKGAVALGATADDDVNLVVRDLVESTGLEYKILEADGGIAIPGTLTVSGSTTMTRYALRENNTQLWLKHEPPPGTVIWIN
ncbi:MAG: hypothetical protein ACOX9C_04680 [Kiritimatiellia bacterium]